MSYLGLNLNDSGYWNASNKVDPDAMTEGRAVTTFPYGLYKSARTPEYFIYPTTGRDTLTQTEWQNLLDNYGPSIRSTYDPYGGAYRRAFGTSEITGNPINTWNGVTYEQSPAWQQGDAYANNGYLLHLTDLLTGSQSPRTINDYFSSLDPNDPNAGANAYTAFLNDANSAASGQMLRDYSQQQFDSAAGRMAASYLRHGLSPAAAKRHSSIGLLPTQDRYNSMIDQAYGQLPSFDAAWKTIDMNNTSNPYLDAMVNPVTNAFNNLSEATGNKSLADYLVGLVNKFVAKDADLIARRGLGAQTPAAPGQEVSTVFPGIQAGTRSGPFEGKVKEKV